MTIFDESGPWTPTHFRKYQLYLSLRKEREKFLKNIREMTYCEWKIDKLLIEAGGLGKTVYILPARGGGTQFRTLRRINELLEEGRDVEPVTLRKYETPKFSDKDISTIRESIQQFELYSKLVKPWRDPMYEHLFNDYELRDPYIFEPSYTIDPDGRVRIRDVSIVRKENECETTRI